MRAAVGLITRALPVPPPHCVQFFWAYFSVFVSNVWFATMGQALIAVFPQKLFASLVVGPIVQMTLVFAGINVPVYR